MNSTNISIYRDGKDYFNIFGLNINTPDFDDSSVIINDLANNKRASYVCIVNTHIVIETVRNSNYLNILNQSDCNLPDGMPLVWYAKKVLGLNHVMQVSGPDLMKKCFEELYDSKHFFYGSTRETLNKIERIGRNAKHKLNIAGSYSPPFRNLKPSEKKHVISMMNDISPDIIWIALGAPKQEYWMHEIKKDLKKGVMIGVGAAFDYFVGNIHRPPTWIRRSGMEWLCRLIQEPGRLWKRYLIANSLFLFLVLKEIVLSHNERKIRKIL